MEAAEGSEIRLDLLQQIPLCLRKMSEITNRSRVG